MIVNKGIGILGLIRSSAHHILWLVIGATIIALLYHYEYMSFSIPWLPVSVIGTAVAFYAGFKNNQAYNRMWEARKIWGGIVNESRTWGMVVDGFVTNQFAKEQIEESEIKDIKTRLIYRHIAWLYTHRKQLLVPTTWEHVSQGGMVAWYARRFRENYGIGLVADENVDDQVKKLLSGEECEVLMNSANAATQIINHQSRELTKLRERGLIDDFRHMEMENVLRSFYTLQGKNERIKKFPLPRMQANMSRYFVGIFIAMMPFSMIPSLMDLGTWGVLLSIMVTALIGWVYVMMEIVGDYSENPFQGMANDIPMLSLVRTIEIDMRQMLSETDLPEPIKAKKGVLM